MAVAKITLNGVTQIDLTQDTIDAASAASGVIGHQNDGTTFTGAITTVTQATPSITVSNTGLITATASQAAGIVAAGSKSATEQLTTKGATTIVPNESEQTAVAAQIFTTGIVKVAGISSDYIGSGVAQKTSSNLTASGSIVTAESGYYAASASKAVAAGTATTPATTITASPTISVSASGLITATVAGSSNVTPTISAGYISSGTSGTISVSGSNTSQLATKSASDLTASGSVVTVPSGFYAAQASKAVSAGTAGTPTAAKGTVSNHAITVTPSVTNTAGYIAGGTINGTGVSVSASELVSGSSNITSNGTVDVTNLASVVVAVEGASGVKTGTLTVASNVNTSTSTQITTTTAIGFTPKVFVFYRSDRSATSNHVNAATFITLGSSYYIRTMTRYSSNALSTSGNANNWTTQTAGYLYFNSNTIYFRSSSSYILPSGTWNWIAIQ